MFKNVRHVEGLELLDEIEIEQVGRTQEGKQSEVPNKYTAESSSLGLQK